ncbi:MAG TPA: phosphatase PAP2 family protein [Allosphingosinicella sp.]|nr:phosphatase PAP2 family protein [Allosphingosinicella sp.]
MDGVTLLLFRLSDAIFGALNGLTGRSWLFDTLVSLPVDNNLVKAGPIGACFVYAWWSGRDEEQTRKRRASLLVTIASLLFVLGATKTLSHEFFLPRPFVQSQPAWHLEEGKLVESQHLAYRPPLSGSTHARYEAMKRGDIEQNDLVSFPSDHAGFFVALSLGIFFASRRSGAVALAWTFGAILLGRIATGMHSPLDVAAGAAIGAGIMTAIQLAARRGGRWALEPIAGWTMRHEALAAALLFFVAVEWTSVLTNARELAATAADILSAVAGKF